MEIDDNWLNCYKCAKAGYMPDMVLYHTLQGAKLVHEECLPELPPETVVSEEELNYIVAHPIKWANEKRADALPSYKCKTYFITFTTKPGVKRDKWIKRLRFELSRKYVKSFEMCIEHEDTNLHAHVLLSSDRYLKRKKHFKTYLNTFGTVDIQKVVKDNGLHSYLEKEGEAITDVNKIE